MPFSPRHFRAFDIIRTERSGQLPSWTSLRPSSARAICMGAYGLYFVAHDLASSARIAYPGRVAVERERLPCRD
jgi:hypothetical protein